MNSAAKVGQSSHSVSVNGAAVELPASFSIDDLIAQMAVAGRYAVEINGEIVPRSEHGKRQLAHGDTIEIVAAIGGG